MDLSKKYVGVIKLGEETNTNDITGNIVSSKPVPDITIDNIKTITQQFTGEIQQVPPMFSAKKVNGKRLYQIARKGKIIERSPCLVNVYSLEIISYRAPLLSIEVCCSKGTYIRALARDIGREIGCGAFLKSLIRTQIGDYKVENSLTIDEFNRKMMKI